MPSLTLRRRVGLADEEAGQRAGTVHLMIRQHAHSLQLIVVEQMRLVDHEDGHSASLCVLGGERVGGLRDEGGLLALGDAAERGDDGVVDPADPDGGGG